ncbi:Multiple RNA-binding domain-containing protein 1 [Tulasnella sp. 418]|nr:Multiple RNA-binding domain-containing protein 1 [Tulasnella sp. 418]
MPRKFDAKTRGFAFLEFVSRRDAENAFEALMHTHLLGRHLVLEWSEQGVETQVDELREKIKNGYVEKGKEVAGRKRKIEIINQANDGTDDD